MLIRRYRNEQRQSKTGREEGQTTEKEQTEKTYSEMTVAELKEEAQKKEIEGYSNMKKAELIEALEG